MENTFKPTENPEAEEMELASDSPEETQEPVSQKGPGLTQRKMDDYLRFFIFLVLIGLGYIWNSHLAEKQVIKEDQLKKEIRDLRLHYISLESSLSERKKPSVVADSMEKKGLYLLTTAPYQLEKDSE